jgi:pyruvate dehydrogenase (quinone)
MAGSPTFPPSQHIPDFPYAGFAESIGLGGIKVTEPDRITGAWEQAVAADRPCVVEFVTDPTVPPIPPHATLDQLEKTAEALLRGDPEAWDVVRTGVKSKAQEFLPGRG